MPKANVNGINISYGADGHGEPLVLIMGFAGPKIGWIFQNCFFKKHYQVITLDNRGVWRTDKPKGPYSTKMMADDTVGLMDHLGIKKAHILGVSMGGMIAQELAINYPERVQKLVLGCTYASRDETGGLTPEYYKGIGFDEGSSNDELKKVAMGRLLTTVFSLSFSNRLYRMLATLLAKMYVILLSTKGVRAQYEATLEHNALDRLHDIKAPTLVIAGTQDKLIRPGSSEIIADRIPNAEIIKVKDGSHSFFIEMKGRFNKEVLAFLREEK
jgi:pimeloyl-ACP methyl ester carboxylesterase